LHVKKLRYYRKYHRHLILKEERILLDKMGFVWNANDGKFRRLVEGITTYYKLYGHFIISTTFVVPHDDPKWPKLLWGLTLGSGFKNLRIENLPLKKAQYMKSKGVPLDRLKAMKAERLLVALEAYKVHACVPPDREFVVPRKFKIPEGNHLWEPPAWGLMLGMAAHGVRYKNYFPDYKEKFRSLGLRISELPAGSEEASQTPAAEGEGESQERREKDEEDGSGGEESEDEDEEGRLDEDFDGDDDQEGEGEEMSEDEVAAKLAEKVAREVAAAKAKAKAVAKARRDTKKTESGAEVPQKAASVVAPEAKGSRKAQQGVKTVNEPV
jgi:hypothetical protein